MYIKAFFHILILIFCIDNSEKYLNKTRNKIDTMKISIVSGE